MNFVNLIPLSILRLLGDNSIVISIKKAASQFAKRLFFKRIFMFFKSRLIAYLLYQLQRLLISWLNDQRFLSKLFNFYQVID